MRVISNTESFLYLSDGGDWALRVSEDSYELLPQGGGLVYTSGLNIENLAIFILEVKQHAINNNINWV
jgi:hypothetical protein